MPSSRGSGALFPGGAENRFLRNMLRSVFLRRRDRSRNCVRWLGTLLANLASPSSALPHLLAVSATPQLEVLLRERSARPRFKVALEGERPRVIIERHARPNSPRPELCGVDGLSGVMRCKARINVVGDADIEVVAVFALKNVYVFHPPVRRLSVERTEGLPSRSCARGKGPPSPFGLRRDSLLCACAQRRLVRSRGLEPPRCYSLPPQGSASTNSATSAF